MLRIPAPPRLRSRPEETSLVEWALLRRVDDFESVCLCRSGDVSGRRHVSRATRDSRHRNDDFTLRFDLGQ